MSESELSIVGALLQRTQSSLLNLQHDYQQYDVGAWLKAGLYLALTLWLAQVISVSFYRLYLSPLSRIPGPRLAALTYLYEAYYEVWLGGQYFRRIAAMHEQYGPVVRISPNEVHWNDPEFVDTIYPTVGRRTDKPAWIAQRTGTPFSIVSTPDHDLHRRRRNALNSFFSAASIRRLEVVLKEYVEKMLARMEKVANSEDPVLQFHNMFKACASDVITIYAFGECFGFMELPDFGWSFFESSDSFFFLTHLFFLIPGLVQLTQSAPGWLVRRIYPALGELKDRQDWWLKRVIDIRTSPNRDRVKSTIFEGILDSSLPESEKTNERLASEAQLVVFAGEGTVAYTLTCALYHLLASPAVLSKLKSELLSAGLERDSIPSISQVDALPYLSAVIQEVIRLHPGAMNRQVRISPEVPIIYSSAFDGNEYVIPPGTVTSTSPLDIHLHPAAFGDDAYEFRPERWIENPKLSRYFIGFSKGSRNCVGMALARREMALILASIFLKYDLYRGQEVGPTLELYETERARDIDANSDYIIPVPAKGSKGLRVKIRR